MVHTFTVDKPVRHIVLGTAGHIDHGKTSLVKALTGQDCDRLGEEKRRGITIELGFAAWDLGLDPTGRPIQASIIDVPGHEKLVRTMVAGAGGMDLAMMVVAADDGVMPQTREHLDILRLLGVSQCIVVLTKMDRIDHDQELVEWLEMDVAEALADTPFADAPVIPTSSKTKTGLDTLTESVLALLEKLNTRVDEGPCFMPIDRVFSKAGYGTIVTGTTLRGTLKRGDEAVVLGNSIAPLEGLKVRGLQALGQDQQMVAPGMRTAVNVTGKAAEYIHRGMILASPNAFQTSLTCVAWIEVLSHATPLKDETLIAHLGTTEREARILPLGNREILATHQAGILLRFKEPVAIFAGQRLVLRRPGLHSQATIAGGEILDPTPPEGKGSLSLVASQIPLLTSSVKDRLLALARESRARGVSLHEIARRLPPGAGEQSARSLEKKGKLIRVGNEKTSFVDRDVFQELIKKVVVWTEDHHNAHPTSPGMAEGEIQSKLPKPEKHLAPDLIRHALSQKKLLRDGPHLALPGRGAAIDEETQKALSLVLDLFAKAGATPPTDKDILSTLNLSIKRVSELLSILRRQKKLFKVAEGLHYSSHELTIISGKVISALRPGVSLPASAMKAVLGGLSRKYTIPLLEYLDRQKVTQRHGDTRRLHPSQAVETKGN
jgi:selenocysteine-specific elongation factor